MLVRVERSGLSESFHDGVIAVTDAGGQLVHAVGDTERQFFFRSAAKPFQALVAQDAGADLTLDQVALASASHGGQPIHVALVRRMLSEVGISEDQLLCPPARPLAQSARDRLAREGAGPARVYHNCSGKHAAMLRACRAQGWPLDSYLDPDHPLQRSVTETVSEVTGEVTEPVGVDGCGVPVHRVTAAGASRAYAALAVRDDLVPVWEAMHRRPVLTPDQEFPAARLGSWLELVAKHGAEGILGAAVRSRFGVLVKVWDGSIRAASVALVGTLHQLGLVPEYVESYLSDLLDPPLLGGGERVGSLVPVFQL